MVKMHCGSWPYSACSVRPISRLNFWSVPPSSRSLLQRHGVVALHQRVQEFMHAIGVPALKRSWKSLRSIMRATV